MPEETAVPPVTNIATIGQHEGLSVTLRGWLYNLRESGKLLFPIFRDGSGIIQGVVDAFGAGDVSRARQIHYDLIPVYDGLFRNQGAVMTKAALDLLGLPGGAVRGPLLAATEAERHQLALDLTAGGVKLPGTAA